MIQKTRKRKWFKGFIIFQLICLINLFVIPNAAYALTGGPSQPEVQGFEPIGTSDMVNLFTGDFKYNIPLMDIGGYPINMSYQGGVGMDQEASWVGLGWTLNIGAITRAMRGLPDDFSGDKVVKEMNVRPTKVWGGNLAIGNIEVVGLPIVKLDAGIGAFYNNYKGIGFEQSLDVNIGIANKQKGKLNVGLGLTSNSQEGIGINPTLSASISADKLASKDAGPSAFSGNFGSSFESRSGFKTLTIGVSTEFKNNKTKNDHLRRLSTQPINGGASIPMSLQTYTPQISMPMSNSSNMLHAGVGLEGWWVNGKGKLSGYYNNQELLYKKISSSAYGYLYAQNGQYNPQALLDFNREKDGIFTRNTPSLPLTNFTYDAFNISAQGVGGMYRPFRSDVGTVFDNQVMNFSQSSRIGVDFGSANTAKGGANGGFNFNTTTSGKWSAANLAGNALSFKDKSDVSSTHIHSYEPYYFKQAGEMVPVDDNFHSQMGYNDPVRVEITDEGNVSNLKRKTSLSSLSEQNLPMPDKKYDREKRNQVLSVLTANEWRFALNKKIESYRFSNKQTGEEIKIASDRTAIAKDHHLSELTVLRPDGARYVFGIPAYNITQTDATFNVEGSTDCVTGQVSYNSGGSQADNSTDNKKGLDNYYSSTTIPPFAHSYLLSGVLSPDYVDRSNDGLTEDDFGSYTKFKYQKIEYGPNHYNWRVPFKKNSANFNEGLKADTEDDKASYTYGQRDNWYIHAIETKTHRAEFYTSPRKDGFGVQDKNGGINENNPVYRLDSIKLFALCDRVENKEDAEVIKAVHFRYTYELCPNVDNNNQAQEIVDSIDVNLNRGKLTLKKVFFTYGKSKKGMLSPYQLFYADYDSDKIPDSGYNPDYHLKGYDRWGNYKKNEADNCDPLDTDLSNAEFPYVEQDKTSADKNAAAWSLNRIQLPSGGIINVQYEADDYAYVQDKRAMQMIEVTGISNNPALAFSDQFYSFLNENHYLRIKLPQRVNDDDELREQYFLDEDGKEIKSMFFKFLIDIIGNQAGIGSNPEAYEYVSGYAEIESFKFIDPFQAWIKLKPVPISDRSGSKKINPILKTSFQFARLHLSKMVYPGSDPSQGQLKNAIMGLLSFMSDLRMMATGFNNTLQDWNFSKKAFLPKSRVRLFAPTYNQSGVFTNSKLGGGARVSKVTISDSWAEMVDHGRSFEYGQEYFYTTVNEHGKKISSGVAEYEPMIGNEENPFRQQVAYTDEHKMAPDNEFYKEEPFGESFFPSPNVGYSEVKVRNLQHTGVKRNATGLVRHLFYTAKDYPVYTDQTKLESKSAKPSWLKKILKKDIKERMVASQGFAIYLNNMHGQQKAQWVYPEYPDGTTYDEYKPISGVEYFYQSQSNNSKRLDNEVKAISKTGDVTKVTVGKEIDLISDMRENKSNMAGLTMAFNLDLSTLPPIPVPIPSSWPTFSTEETIFRSTTMTKVVTSYGILEKTVAYDLGSRVSTENLAFDAETGELLVTRTKNDFEDYIYSYTYPAHLAYDKGMGMAYKNLGMQFDGSDYTYSFGNLNFSNIYEPSFFTEGDELSIANVRYWVTNVSSTNITIANDIGISPISLNSPIKIIRSGRRNMQTTPIGTITSKVNPIAGGTLHLFTESDEIINAGAVEFADDWNGFCECGIDVNDRLGEKNPYILGWKGNWRAKMSLAYLTNRLQENLNRNTNIREDGIFSNFDRYWIHDGLGNWNPNPGVLGGFNNWTFTSEVTLFSPFGFELENRDALNRYSSAIYGYDQTLPTAVASNSRYKEIGFESFEDHGCKSCTDDHFSFSESTPQVNISTTESHTGFRSISIQPGDSVEVRKIIVPCDKEDNEKRANRVNF